MKSIALLAWIAVISSAVLGLFYISSEVQRIEDSLLQERRSITERQRTIHVLEAEWSYLNQPARLAELARRHLGLTPMGADQVLPLDALPQRSHRLADRSDAKATRTQP